jgi:hypothetical protein
MMRGTAKFPNPDDTVLELTVSATVKEWRDIMRQLPTSWPSWELGTLIADAIGKSVGRVETIHEVSS